ncbi:MAG: CDP-diacylglycerol--glycerol-3-phosphate 3-phosphatidyltransferase, partial [Rhodocyclales bacterium CG17_big_fil_post_rev_8_21_14_2_50_68_7]
IPMLLFHGLLLGIDTHLVGTLLLYVAAFLTLWSMVYYLRRAAPYLSAGTTPERRRPEGGPH